MRATIAIIVVAVELLAPSLARTQSRATLVPAVSISTVHDDNPFTGPDGAGDFLTQVRPFLEANYESPTLTMLSELSFDMQRSLRHSALNTVDARRHGMVDSRIRTSATTYLGLIGRYDRTETPGELNLETGVLNPRQRATRWQVTPSLSYRATARTTITTQYDWTNEALSGEPAADLHIARLGVSRQTSPRTQWSLRYLGRLFDDPLHEHHSQAALLGWTRELAPGANLFVLAGPRVTTYGGTTAEVLAAFLRRTPRSRFLLDYWRGETIILGIPGPVEIHSGTNKITWFLNRNLELGTHVGVFRSTTLESTKALVYHGSLVGSWSFREPYTLSVTYGADFQRGDIRNRLMADDRVQRGVLLVRLTIAPRLSRAFKAPEDSDQPMTPMKGVLQ